MRNLLAVVTVAALAIPLAGAQESGVTAEGWEVKLDRGMNVDDLFFRTMGSGFHVTTGPAAIFWQPGSMQKGEYSISATFVQTKPSNHPNAYGLVFGGSGLSGSNQRYSYFVIREDGRFLIKKRMGSDTPTVVDWTANAALNELGAEGRAKNTLTVEVGRQQVRFLVNDKEVSTQPRSAVDTDGIVGLRINHVLDIHIADLELGGM